MTTRTTRQQRTVEHIVEADAAAARAAGEATIIARARAEAPLAWTDLIGLTVAQLGERLAGLDAATIRLVAIRLVVERAEARGRMWGWGDVDAAEAWLTERAAAVANPAPVPDLGSAPALRGSSIAHVDGVERHGLVLIARSADRQVRRVFYGTPACCVAICNVTGTKVYSNAITGERIGGLRRLLALAEQRGRRELAALNA